MDVLQFPHLWRLHDEKGLALTPYLSKRSFAPTPSPSHDDHHPFPLRPRRPPRGDPRGLLARDLRRTRHATTIASEAQAFRAVAIVTASDRLDQSREEDVAAFQKRYGSRPNAPIPQLAHKGERVGTVKKTIKRIAANAACLN